VLFAAADVELTNQCKRNLRDSGRLSRQMKALADINDMPLYAPSGVPEHAASSSHIAGAWHHYQRLSRSKQSEQRRVTITGLGVRSQLYFVLATDQGY
jgi:hypothetical protein